MGHGADLTPVFVGHETFLTHSSVGHEHHTNLISLVRLVKICGITHSFVGHETFLIYPSVGHDSDEINHRHNP